MVFPSLMAWLYFVVLDSQTNRGTMAGRDPAVVAVFSAAKTLQFAFPLIWVTAIERRRPRITPPVSTGLIPGIVFGLLVGGGIVAVFYVFVRTGNWIPLAEPVARLKSKVDQFGLGTPAAYVAFGLFLAGVHSLLEEYYWRWFVFGGLADWMPLWRAIALSSLGFMAHHVIDLAVFLPGHFWLVVIPMSAAVGIGGAFWAWLYARSGSLYPAWISHLLVDAAIMVVGYNLIFASGAGH